MVGVAGEGRCAVSGGDPGGEGGGDGRHAGPGALTAEVLLDEAPGEPVDAGGHGGVGGEDGPGAHGLQCHVHAHTLGRDDLGAGGVGGPGVLAKGVVAGEGDQPVARTGGNAAAEGVVGEGGGDSGTGQIRLPHQ